MFIIFCYDDFLVSGASGLPQCVPTSDYHPVPFTCASRNGWVTVVYVYCKRIRVFVETNTRVHYKRIRVFVKNDYLVIVETKSRFCLKRNLESV